MAQNPNYFAILVGISRYADSNLHPLDGPVRDVHLMEDWLVLENGGNVPPANVKTIISDESSQVAATDGEMPPVFLDFFNAFLRLVRKPDKSGYIRRASSRLYLYFSGHGFCEKRKREAHAALYVANADRDVNWNIYGTYFAQWTKDQGLFDEIVLIMDCCRDAELAKQPLEPPLRRPTDIGIASNAKLFELYAAPRGGKAQERPIPSRNNEVHGLLTHAFLDALEHADPGKPVVSTSEIKKYLEERWSALCGTEPADPPEVVVPSNGEILFRRATALGLPQRFKLNRLNVGDSFEIIDASLSVVAQVTLLAGEAQVIWPFRAMTTPCTIDNGIFIVPLPATYYMIVAATSGGMLRRKFQAGDGDVEL
ncbi:MAG TPA: caspase family protein [Candidatus Competibacter sp.]|jgi:hypothetical protein|nr:caspase family protein [Candidatus Competibacter sp.]